MTNQVFGWAIKQLREGKRVQRAGWNGKGMFLFFVHEWSFDAEPMPEFAKDIEVMSFVAMKTADNKIVPWLASQTDMLASDWSVVE